MTRPEFSICIPTYNRGPRALAAVKKLLPAMDFDWELVVLDNASTDGIDEYQQIHALAETHENLRYIRHQTNCFFQGNYLASLENARASYCMVVSDEDHANPEMIREVIPLLRENPRIGILRGSVAPLEPGQKPQNSFTHPEKVMRAGKEALFGYGLLNNYFSGTIYNREVIARHDLLARLREGLEKHRIYPHLFFELLLCAVADVVTTGKISCHEGVCEFTSGGDPVMGQSQGVMDYAAPYSFGSRVDQFIVLRDAIRDAVTLMGKPFDLNVFVNMYVGLCHKYLRLVGLVNAPLYEKMFMHPIMVLKSMLFVCTAAISAYPELEAHRKQITDAITEICAAQEQEMIRLTARRKG